MGAKNSETRRSTVPKQREVYLATQPIDGESLASWIAAVARRAGMEITALLRDLRLTTDGSLVLAQTRLPAATARRLSNRTGLDEAVLNGMTLARYAGNALPHLPLSPQSDSVAFRQWSSSAWLSSHQARWCAPCLREDDRRWQLRWMLPWTFVCLKHRVYLASECIRCLSPVYYGTHSALPGVCGARVSERHYQYGYDEQCEFPLNMDRPLPVSDDTIFLLQETINRWLDGSPTVDDRQLVSLTALMVLLVTPSMMRMRGEDPALLCGLRSRRSPGGTQERGLWADPLRVAAAAQVSARLLRSGPSPASVAESISDLRTISYQETPWRLDVMDWAYGAALRPNPYVDELVRRGVIVIGTFRHP